MLSFITVSQIILTNTEIVNSCDKKYALNNNVHCKY